MQKIIFFDTETTGNTDKDFLCQIAYKCEGESFESLYKPQIKIPPGASAVHNISNKMVADLPAFQESDDYEKIKKLFEDPDTILVAHNAPFDIAVLKNDGIYAKKYIDTLRVARELDKDEKIESYRLQFLRYYLDIEIEAEAHSALGDVLVLEELFERLKTKIKTEKNCSDEEAVDEMLNISSRPSLLHTFKFGKYNGKRIEDVARTDRGYLEWLLNQKLNGDGPDEDWIYTLKHYLNK